MVTIGIDIGGFALVLRPHAAGTLSKIAYLQPDDGTGLDPELDAYITSAETYGSTGSRDPSFAFQSDTPPHALTAAVSEPSASGTLHFIRFETRRMESFAQLLKERGIIPRTGFVAATGGGSYKYHDLFKTELGLEWTHVDEMEALIVGLAFLLRRVPDESFIFAHPSSSSLKDQERIPVPPPNDVPPPRRVSPAQAELFPLLLVNIGSGVSILKINADLSFERVSGSSLGGGTYWGLGRLLTGCERFDEMADLALAGPCSIFLVFNLPRTFEHRRHVRPRHLRRHLRRVGPPRRRCRVFVKGGGVSFNDC